MKAKRIRSRRRRGFTLMEVLLVLAILVILGSMVTFYFANIQRTSYAKLALSQINLFEDMLEAYHLDVGMYPTTNQTLEALRQAPPDLVNPLKWGGPYLKEAIPPDPWGNPYIYEGDGATYVISSNGPDGMPGTGDEVMSSG